MPESFRIKGKFFNIKTELELSPKQGYRPIKSILWRNISIERSNQFVESTHPESLTSIAKISEILGFSISILECNFDRWSLYSENKIKHFELNISKAFQDKLLLRQKEAILNAFEFNPIIPTSKVESDINLHILKFIAPNLKNKITTSAKSLVILTGEMIWSKWMNLPICYSIINSFVSQSGYFVIDSMAVWQNILQSSFTDKTVQNLNRKALKPNVYLHVRRKNDSQVKLESEDGVKLLHIIPGQMNIFTNVENTKIEENLLPELLFVVDNVQKLKYNYEKLLALEGVQHDIDIYQNRIINDSPYLPIYLKNAKFLFKKDQRLKVNDKIASFEHQYYKIIELNKYSKDIKLLVRHGEKIAKDECIGMNQSVMGRLLAEKYYSPCDGFVDLSLENEGLLIIVENKRIIEYKADFTGQIMHLNLNQDFTLNTNCKLIPLTIYSGANVSGKLVDRIITSDITPKIFYIGDLSQFNYTLEELLNNLVVGLIVLNCNLLEYLAFQKKHLDISKWYKINVIDAYCADTNPLIKDILKKVLNCTISINKNGIFVQEEDLRDYHLTSQPIKAKVTSGSLVKVFSYFSNKKYYKVVKKLDKGRFLLSNKYNILETNANNILLT